MSFHRALGEPAAWYRVDTTVKVTVMMGSCKADDLDVICPFLFKLPKFV